MDVRTRYVLIALGVVAVIVVAATILLPRKARLALYAALIVIAGGAAGYVVLVRNLLPGSYALETYASGLFLPTFALPDPLDTGRMFVLEKYGTVRIIDNGALLEEPFLDLSDKVAADGGEQGLLSMVFHPDYKENGYFYILYTTVPDDEAVLSRFETDANNPDRALSESEVRMVIVPHPTTHHNGGHLEFGPDGYLYVSLGDGAGKGWPGDAQDLSNLLGTMLRLDVSQPGADPPYRVPEDNPFVNEPSALPEIWAFGLRNPWRFDFDMVSGELFIADVGEQAQEEVNYTPADQGSGANYGWRYYEGTKQVKDRDDYPPDDAFIFPVTEYNHMSLGGCSITGGYVYHGQSLPELDGRFLYADYCSGFIWSLEVDENGRHNEDRLLRQQGVTIASFAKDHEGELYVVDLGGGRIFRLVER